MFFDPITCIASCLEEVLPNYFKLCNNLLVRTLYTSVYTFFPILIFKVKSSVFDPKLVFLPVWNMSNQITSNYAIVFLFLPFILLRIQFYPISIFKVKNSVFTPKTYISFCSQHVKPNFIKIDNNVLVRTLYTSLYTFFSYFNF